MLRVESFFAGNPAEATEAVVARALRGDGGYVCLANAHVVATANRDEALRRALENAWRVFPDGWPVAWLQRRLGDRRARRVAGPDLMPAVVQAGQSAELRHFLLGSTKEVVDRLQSELRLRYPDARIVGVLCPVITDPFARVEPAINAAIQVADPHIVWCAFGAPKQEQWMYAHAESLAPALFIGVGAAFDFLARVKPRAPHWVQQVGLEWLHRLLSEPLRLGLRYVQTNTEFITFSAATLCTRRHARAAGG
jgi:N-acetylglucosaminyldiphosphoundecaprenol N-acetyl-beta-D-mannosaminyltransferase